MYSDSPEALALWKSTSLLLYQAGDVQSLIAAGAGKDEVRTSLEKAVELGIEALSVLELCQEEAGSASPYMAVVSLPLHPDSEDEEAA